MLSCNSIIVLSRIIRERDEKKEKVAQSLWKDAAKAFNKKPKVCRREWSWMEEEREGIREERGR